MDKLKVLFQKLGIELTADQTKQIGEVMSKEFVPAAEAAADKTKLDELTKQLAARDKDLAKLKADNKSEELQKQLDELNAKYKQDTDDLNAKLSAQQADFAAEKLFGGYKFASDRVRKSVLDEFKGKGFIEAVSMLAMAVPGTVLGVGYIRGFSGGLFHTGLLSGLYGSAAILIIVFVVRSLPTGTRSGISALRQIDKSIEESAYDMGANSFRVFMTVTLPLIKDSFLSGLVTAFVRSITAISAIILLVTPQFLLITVQINEFAEKGSYSIACAFATILILITYGSVLLMNLAMKFFGTSKKIKEA